ncbi:helix-turn-helix domain-containing protein [uncultured Senegalimassilia sp.]|jgi:hypothetical protein|uniref:helix-turn-helix domain-containing protein n=1 Tax=uncultured Senegalimassilia sp. TaxID=1714350 RepID=UPI0025EAA256|nr:helix-turn-helix domain-containing protein [uncultured Senegalimassilia sp.]
MEKIQGLRKMAVDAGLQNKPMYSVAEIATATGISRSTLNRERYAGRLRYFKPPGMERFVRIRCEWFDEWFNAGTCGGEGE